MEVECDILENPPIRQAWMKKNNISTGTLVDCCNFVNESLAGPYSPTYGQFCSKSVEIGEDSGIVVGKCLFDTYALGEISGAISGESHYVIKWATKEELSALSAETWAAIEELSAELSGSEEVWNAIEELSGDIDNLEYNFEWAKEQIQDVIPQELSTKISYPVIVDNPYGSSEWKLDLSPLDDSLPASAKVVLGSYLDSDNTTWIPYISLGDSNGTTIRIDNTNHLRLGTNSRASTLVNFNDMSAAISALDIDHVIRWFATSSQPNRWIVNFGRSSTGGISFVSDSDHPTQSYIDIAGNIITAPGYDPNFQSRGLKKSRDAEEDNHLQYNQKGLAFVEEVSSVQAEVSSVSQDVQDLSANLTHSIVRRWEYVEYNGLTFTAEEANSTISMQKVGAAPDVSLEYSTGDGWNDFIVGETTVTLPNIGDQVVMRAKTTNSRLGNAWSQYNKFVMTGKIAASDSAMYLLKSDGDLSSFSQTHALKGLFDGCSSLTTSPELPATTLAEFCYQDMFRNCTSLTTPPPSLPAPDLPRACYQGMFNGCTSLAATPATLGATTMSGIDTMGGMFGNCYPLTSAFDINVAAPTSGSFYGTFYGCSSLTSVDMSQMTDAP